MTSLKKLNNKQKQVEKVFKKKTNKKKTTYVPPHSPHPPPPRNHQPPNPTRVAILEGDTSSYPALHSYQVSSKYCEGYLSYKADTKSNSNIRRGDNSNSKKVRVVIPVLHYLPSKIKIIQRVLELQSGYKIKFKHKKGR